MLTREDITAAGFKISQSMGDKFIDRAARMTRTFYLVPVLGDGFEETDEVKRCWSALAVVHLIGDAVHIVQSGGEMKLFDNGTKPDSASRKFYKEEAAAMLRSLGYKRQHVADYLNIFLRTQILN